MKILKARLLEMEQQKQEEEIAESRRARWAPGTKRENSNS